MRLISDRRSPWLGLLAAIACVALTTAVIYPIKEVAPAVSTGVLYLLGVLLVSTFWGALLGALTALAGAAAFNWFHLPPTGQFTVADAENWVALAVFLVAALMASSVAEVARAQAREAELRRREASLAAALARLLLEGDSARSSLRPAARLLSEALDVEVSIEPGEADPGERIAIPLRSGDRTTATLLLASDAQDDVRERAGDRIAPSLQALLAVAFARDELQAEVVETRALRRSDDIKTALLRSVSHDLRSPLTAIVASADALKSATLQPGERTELLDSIGMEARRLSHLVEQLLDLSRLQAGAAEPRRDWVSLEEVVRAAVQGLGAEDTVRVSIDAELPLVEADAVQLERAFSNLLENARHHAPGTPVLVRGRETGGRVLMRFVDQGPGIPQRELERIFEPFYQPDGDGPQRGAGLGLAVVRGFVELNGGRVHAESLPGQGTSFVVEFPLPARVPA